MARINYYKGTLTTKGVSRVAGNSTTYTYLQVGDDRIKNIAVTDYYDNFLTIGDEVELWVFQKSKNKEEYGLVGLRTKTEPLMKITHKELLPLYIAQGFVSILFALFGIPFFIGGLIGFNFFGLIVGGILLYISYRYIDGPLALYKELSAIR